jgi:SSS family solute:Na+ symporter
VSALDLFCIAGYFAAVAFIGWRSGRNSRRDSRSYFLGGGSIGWIAIGASLFATNISAEHFIGLAGTGSSSGLAVGQFEWLACLILLLLGWLFVPFYLKTGVFTMPEFLERRYNPQCRAYLSFISLVAYVFTKISVAVYAGALVLQTILGWNIWVGAVVLIVATGLYTIFGGLRTVIYTDYFQALILVGGGIFLTVSAVGDVGGLGALAQSVEPHFFNLWKSVDHPEFPWTGILFGAPILGIWYWCTDQVIVQRALAAKDIEEARRAAILAGFLKILPVFILVLPGLAGRVLFPDTAPDRMYATMVNELLPPGVKGLVIAGLLAALMSSLSSVFNSSSTLLVMDFYKKTHPRASERDLVRAGEWSTVALVVVGLLWLPFIGIMSNQIYVYLQSVQAYISPPIAAVFLLGILWKRANGTGAFAALVAGFALGALRFIAEIGMKAGWLTWEPLVAYASINFLHFAILIFAVSVLVVGAVSVLTPAPSAAQLGIFGASAGAAREHAGTPRAHKINAALSLFLVLTVLALWAVFSPLFFR